MKVLFQSYLDKVSTLKDGSLKVTLHTQELDATDSAALFGLRNQLGWSLLSTNDINEEDIPDEPAKDFREQKSQSQRLRAVLYVYWQQQGSTGSYDQFYQNQMERFIDQVKEQLDSEVGTTARRAQ
jgi:hypothetical protein